jgi:hypothetical protein
MGRIADEFRAGQNDAKLKSHGDAVFRAFLTAIAIVVAWFSPVPIWAKVLIFVGVMFVIGLAVQFVKIRR